ncbi:MAG: hypothetical protein ACJ8G5_14325, partial [Burkholderiales bacterium]
MTGVRDLALALPEWQTGRLAPATVEWRSGTLPNGPAGSFAIGAADFVEATGWQDRGAFISVSPLDVNQFP